jgi:hypothetical protein
MAVICASFFIGDFYLSGIGRIPFFDFLTKRDTAMDWLWIVLQSNICLKIENKTRSASRRKAKSSGHFSLLVLKNALKFRLSL